MTFMDACHTNFEAESYEATGKLLLYVQTICPVGGLEGLAFRDALVKFCEQMKWPTHIDAQGLTLIGKDKTK